MKAVSAIVLAAGSGSRFGKAKQFLELTPGVRLVDAALDTAFTVSDNITLVLPADHSWEGREVHATVTGGATRLESVAAGLPALLEDRQIVVIHDAAHPLATRATFLDVIEAVEAGADAAVPVLPLSDVVKRQDHRGRLTTVGRDGLGLAQVPMAFSAEALLSAHAQTPISDSLWEDSMLVECNGGDVVSVRGSSGNIHVVTPGDLNIVRILAARQMMQPPI